MLALVLAARPASAGSARLDVRTADASDAWRHGRSSPFVVTLTGLAEPSAPVRVDCWGVENNYVRARDVRIGAPTQAVSDFPRRTIPEREEVRCTAYEGDRTIASWRGTLAWPRTTLPDHRITNVVADRCDQGWCVDVTLDRSHPGLVGAEVDVTCTLRHARSKRWFVALAPSSNASASTTQGHVRLELEDAPGAALIECSVDRGPFGTTDADATNNDASITVARPRSSNARIAFVGPVGVEVTSPCSHCCSHVPGGIHLEMRIKNHGSAAVSGIGVRCEADANGTELELLGTTEELAGGDSSSATVSIEQSAAVTRKLVGKLRTRCEAVVWDQPARKTARWTGTVSFPKP